MKEGGSAGLIPSQFLEEKRKAFVRRDWDNSGEELLTSNRQGGAGLTFCLWFCFVLFFLKSQMNLFEIHGELIFPAHLLFSSLIFMLFCHLLVVYQNPVTNSPLLGRAILLPPHKTTGQLTVESQCVV